MQGKKRVFVAVMFATVLILGISFASAGLFGDAWSKITGKALSSTARVNVTGAATPPIIWFVSKLSGTGGNANPIGAASSADFSFSFLACSIAGENTLPSDTSGGKVSATFNGTFGGGPQIIDSISCQYIGVVNQLPGGSLCASKSKNYSCTGRFYYYYDPAPAIWGINATLLDLSPTPKRAVNNTQTFYIGNVQYWDMDPHYVNWSSVESGGSPALSDNNITIINQGNFNIDSAGTYPLYANGTNLSSAGSDKIRPMDFNVSSPSSNPCRVGTQLVDSTFVNVAGFVIDHTQSTQTIPKNNTLSFCLRTINVAPGLYETVTTSPWVIKAFS